MLRFRLDWVIPGERDWLKIELAVSAGVLPTLEISQVRTFDHDVFPEIVLYSDPTEDGKK